MVQLREKELSSLDFYWQAIKIKQITDSYHIPLIINDRVDIAMAVQADGVHIGQHDIPAAAVRKMIGKDMLLGVSVSTVEQAIKAQQDDADYPDIFEYAAQKLSVAPERCIVFDDVLPAIRSAKQAKMLAGGVYDKYSADQRREIEKIADIYLLDFKLAPIPRKGV